MKKFGRGKGKVKNNQSNSSSGNIGETKGKLCMKGRIYPTKDGYIVRFGRNLSKWFKHGIEAERFLNGLRYETDKGTFDQRDYYSTKPLSFNNLDDKWLAKKKKTIKSKSFNNLNNYMNRAKNEWEDTNIKAIGFAEIEDLFDVQDDISDKTKANMKSCLHNFLTWVLEREYITVDQFPRFPEIKYVLGYRNTTDIETQQAILNEIKRNTFKINSKIWFGINLLSKNIDVRPNEIRTILELEISPKSGLITIPGERTKDGNPKHILLDDEDIEFLNSIPRGLPHLPFFRHVKGIKGCKAGEIFGKKYFYKNWKKACSNLGIDWLDLYGGTKHTTATALGEHHTPEEVIKFTGHRTNKAFERYFQANRPIRKRVKQTLKGMREKAQEDLQHTYNQKNNQKAAN